MPLADIRSERVKKIALLRKAGFDPYPSSTLRTHGISEAVRRFSTLVCSGKKIVLAGRLMAKREHGGSTFADIRDESGTMQVYFKEDALGRKAYRLFLESADMGDIVEAQGTLFETKKGQKTLEAGEWRMLAKSLRPLPEKWHGLGDVEERFRRRYLDTLMNDEVKERFLVRSRLVSFIRGFLEKAGFTEFETPMLQPIPGGALARPFKTHHHALGIDLYLRIAPELFLKRLLVGGFERVFEIGRNFRNEGIDRSHNPEFTMLECYAAWWDEEDMMRFVEKFLAGAVSRFFKKGEIEYEGKRIPVRPPFKRVGFMDLLSRYALINGYGAASRDDMAFKAKQLGVETEKGDGKGKIADEIYKKIARSHLIEPTFVTHHPLDISPLAKRREDASFETRRFQLVVAGMEVANGFAELNDPIDQRRRFEAQESVRAAGEEEAHRFDLDFIEALEYGMPPSAGLGVGIDRLNMLFTNSSNIKETILFPAMRPK